MPAQDIRRGQLIERRIDLVTDERHVEVREALQRLVRGDPVERREAREQRDRAAGTSSR